MRYEIEKPKGTFYTDYDTTYGKCVAIFEHDVRRTVKYVCSTDKVMCDKIEETDTHLIIEI